MRTQYVRRHTSIFYLRTVTTLSFSICGGPVSSQISAGNDNDKYLRSNFAVDDMEAIRQDFLDKRFGNGITEIQWEAIVGWSFGTVLAQLYAETLFAISKKTDSYIAFVPT